MDQEDAVRECGMQSRVQLRADRGSRHVRILVGAQLRWVRLVFIDFDNRSRRRELLVQLVGE